ATSRARHSAAHTSRAPAATPSITCTLSSPSFFFFNDTATTEIYTLSLHDALPISAKDLRIEARSRVAINQVAPFALMVLVLFAFARDPDRGVLVTAAPGLFWVAVLFAALLAVQRSVAVEAADFARDGLRLSGLDPAGIFV